MLRTFTRRMSSEGGRKTYDVVVAGGGLIGASMAALAAGISRPSSAPLRVAVVEGREREAIAKAGKASLEEKLVGPTRVLAVSPGSAEVLTRVGAWAGPEGVGQHAGHYTGMQVWDGVGKGGLAFDAADAAIPELGAIIPNAAVEARIYDVLDSIENVDVYTSTNLHSIARDGKRSVHVSIGDLDVQTPLLIGSDGPGTAVGKAASIERFSLAYDQHGVIADLHLDRPTETAFQVFLESGPLAILPMGGNRASLVWSLPPEVAAEKRGLDPDVFAAQIQAALHAAGSGKKEHHNDVFGTAAHYLANVLAPTGEPGSGLGSLGCGSSFSMDRVPNVVGVTEGTVASWPLSFGLAAKYAAPRMVLIGDAAHTVHPLAGQGANLGFGDINTLTKVLAEAVAAGDDIGDLSVLQRYERKRKPLNTLMATSFDLIKRLFGESHPLVVAARSAGMSAFGSIPFLRAQAMAFAAGKYEDLEIDLSRVPAQAQAAVKGVVDVVKQIR